MAGVRRRSAARNASMTAVDVELTRQARYVVVDVLAAFAPPLLRGYWPRAGDGSGRLAPLATARPRTRVLIASAEMEIIGGSGKFTGVLDSADLIKKVFTAPLWMLMDSWTTVATLVHLRSSPTLATPLPGVVPCGICGVLVHTSSSYKNITFHPTVLLVLQPGL